MASDHVRTVAVRCAVTPKWRTIDRVVPVRTGPDNDMAIRLDTRLYVPKSASHRHPQPAILMTHGFGLEKTSTEVVTTARSCEAARRIGPTWPLISTTRCRSMTRI